MQQTKVIVHELELCCFTSRALMSLTLADSVSLGVGVI